MNFLYIYLILLAYFILWFFISQIKKNNGLIDIAWGFSFVVTAISSIIISGSINVYKVLIFIPIFIWGVRLSSYLLIRNWNKKEDFRYVAMRKKWGKHQKINALFKVFVFQSIFSYIISLPIILTNLYVHETLEVINIVVLVFGVLVFIFGLAFEVLADRALKNFKKNVNNKGKILTTGVWSMSRHPNYFGEATLWWGIGIISISSFVPMTFIGLISPLIITILLRFVSGVPLLEKRYNNHPDFEEYKKTTPIFFPSFKKKTTI